MSGMKIVPAFAVLLLAASTGAAPGPSLALRESRVMIEGAYRAAGRGSYDAGRAALGPAYSPDEARAILERMFLWLAGPEGRAAAAFNEPRALLELAARRAHPQIGDGRYQRSAERWADYVAASAPALSRGLLTSNRTP
jgi:hypothetical protein